VRARVKAKTEVAARRAVRRVAAVRAVEPPDIDDDVEEKARGGVQSIGRAFAILEEVARNRDGIGLADLSKRVGLHNSTTFHLVRTMVSLGYIRQIKDSKRYRIGRPLFALDDVVGHQDGTGSDSLGSLLGDLLGGRRPVERRACDTHGGVCQLCSGTNWRPARRHQFSQARLMP